MTWFVSAVCRRKELLGGRIHRKQSDDTLLIDYVQSFTNINEELRKVYTWAYNANTSYIWIRYSSKLRDWTLLHDKYLEERRQKRTCSATGHSYHTSIFHSTKVCVNQKTTFAICFTHHTEPKTIYSLLCNMSTTTEVFLIIFRHFSNEIVSTIQCC